MKEVTLRTATSAAVDITSASFDLQDLDHFAVSAIFSAGAGDLAGTLVLQASLDNVTFFNVLNSSISVVTSTSAFYDVTKCGYRYVQVKWTASSGTGNLTVFIHVKDPIVKYS